jgi:hypothetical protein
MSYRSESLLDTISPDYIGEDRFTLSVNTASLPARAGKVVILDVSYTGAGVEGVVLPLDFIIQPTFGDGGEVGGYVWKSFTRAAPNQIVWRPALAGKYLVLLRERHHNRWQGRLLVDVAGDTTDVTPWRRKT